MGKVLRDVIPREWYTVLPAEFRTKPELYTPEKVMPLVPEGSRGGL